MSIFKYKAFNERKDKILLSVTAIAISIYMAFSCTYFTASAGTMTHQSSPTVSMVHGMYRMARPPSVRRGRISRPSAILVRNEETICCPPNGVGVNILPDFQITGFVSYDVIVVGSLKKSVAGSAGFSLNCFGCLVFVPADDVAQCRGRVSRPGC